MSMHPSDILILSGSTRNWLPATISRPNHEAYAAKHGYRYQHETFTEGGSWTKPRAIAKAMEDYSFPWVFWIDADAIITNMEKYFFHEDIDPGITMGTDINGPNAGVMMLQNTPMVRQLLWAVNHTGPWAFPEPTTQGRNMGVPNHWQDQSAFRFFALLPPYRELFKFAEQRVMNSYLNELYDDGRPKEMGQWQPGDFVLHLPGIDDQKRVEAMRRTLAKAHFKDREPVKVEKFLLTQSTSPSSGDVTPPNAAHVILRNYEALGDLLLLSTLPDRYDTQEPRAFVTWSTRDKQPRNKEVEDLVLKGNPHMMGVGVNAAGNAGMIHDKEIGRQALLGPPDPIALIERIHGFTEPYNHYPKIYVTPNPLHAFQGAAIFDLNANTQGFKDKDVADWIKFIVQPRIHGLPVYVVNHKKGVAGRHNYNRFVKGSGTTPANLLHYIDMIASCKVFVCLESGSNALASAIKQEKADPSVLCLMSTRTWNGRMFTFPNVEYSVVGTTNPHWWERGSWP